MSILKVKRYRRTVPLSSDWDPIEAARAARPVPKLTNKIDPPRQVKPSRADELPTRVLRTVQKGAAILALATPLEIDRQTAEPFTDALSDRCKDDRMVVLDMSGVLHLDSEGMEALVRFHEKLVGGGVHFATASLRRSVTEILTLAGLDCLLSIFYTVDEAVDSLIREAEGHSRWH